MRGRFVLLIKSTEDGYVKYNVTYFICVHRDKFEALMLHSATTLQPQSVRLLLSDTPFF